jgi:hypothetical protein
MPCARIQLRGDNLSTFAGVDVLTNRQHPRKRLLSNPVEAET